MAAEMRERMIAAIQEHGPLTVRELAEWLQHDMGKVNESMWRARKTHGTRYFRVTGYQRQQGNSGREARVYGLGPGEDVRKPALGLKARRQTQYRYFEKNRALIYAKKKVQRRKTPFVNSVFGSMVAVMAG